MKRRDFLQTVATASVAAPAMAAHPSSVAPAGDDASNRDPKELLRVTQPGERRGDMLYRTLGSTNEKVSVIGLGGSHLGQAPVDAALAKSSFTRPSIAA